MDRGLFHFLNLEYWYCLFYSLFGGRCTYLDQVDPNVGLGDATLSAGQATSTASSGTGGFFSFLSDVGGGAFQVVGGALATAWALYSTLAYTVSGMLAFSIISSVLGILFIRYRELSKYGVLPPEAADAHPLRTRWEKLLEAAMSSDPREWRASILAADVMLGDLLGKFGYQGETTADKMRVIPEDAFVTLPQAWEAHRVRNFVSQRSSDFILTQREAFRVMKLYEQVFEEFKYV
jgi:hypothetical protein